MTARKSKAEVPTEELLDNLNVANAKAEAAAVPVVDDGALVLPAGCEKVILLRADQLRENFARRTASAVPCWLVYVNAPEGLKVFHAWSFHGPDLQPRVNFGGGLPTWMPRAVPGQRAELPGFEWALVASEELTVYTTQRDVSFLPTASALAAQRAGVTAYSPPELQTEGLASALTEAHRVVTSTKTHHAQRAADLIVEVGMRLQAVEAGGPKAVSPQSALYGLPSAEAAHFHTPAFRIVWRMVAGVLHSHRGLQSVENAAHSVTEFLRVLGFVDEARRRAAEQAIASERHASDQTRLRELLA